MREIAILLEKYQLSYQKILINYGLRLGFVEKVYGKIDRANNATNANFALLDPACSDIDLYSKFNGQQDVFGEMFDQLKALQGTLEADLKPLLVEHFSELDKTQPHLWRKLKSDYVLQLHSDVLCDATRAKDHLIDTVYERGEDIRDEKATPEEQEKALAKKKFINQKLQELKEEVDGARTALESTINMALAEQKASNPSGYQEKLHERAFEGEKWLVAKEKWRAAEKKWLDAKANQKRESALLLVSKNTSTSDILDKKISAFWDAQPLPVIDRNSFNSDSEYTIEDNKRKKDYLAVNINNLVIHDDYRDLENYFKSRIENHSHLAGFLMAEYVEPKDIAGLTAASSGCEKTLEDTLLAAKAQALLSKSDFRLAKLWTVVNEIGLYTKLLEIALNGIFEAYGLLLPETFKNGDRMLYRPFLNSLETTMIYGLHQLTSAYKAPLQLQIENSSADQAERDYLQCLPKPLQNAVKSTPFKIVKENHDICINYRSDLHFCSEHQNDSNKKQAQFILFDEQPDYQLKLQLEPDQSDVKSFDLVFNAGNLSTLPRALQKHVETTAQGLFFRLKQLSDEGELEKLVRKYLQTPERILLLKEALQCLDDSRFMIAPDQVRRIAKIACVELTQHLKKLNVTDDLSVAKNVSVMLLTSRKHWEKTKKRYEFNSPVPYKGEMVALIDKKIPLLREELVFEVVEKNDDETTAQGLFFRLKQLSSESELKKLVREHLQSPKGIILLKEALQCFDDARFLIAQDQVRRIATIVYDELTQRLEKLNVTDDLSVAENLSIMLLTSRKNLHESAKWYQLVPNKDKMLALIDKKTPLLKAKSVCEVNELSRCLIEGCDLVKNYQDFFKRSFSSDKKLTQKAFEQLLVNLIKDLEGKDITKRLEAEYKINCLLKEPSIVKIAGISIVMKDAMRQCLLDNYSQPNNSVSVAFKNLVFTRKQNIVDDLKTLLLEKLKTHMHEGVLTSDGIVMLKNFILMDQKKILFAELLKHDSEQPYQAIIATIRADCFLLDYIKAQTRLKPLSFSPKNLLTTKTKVQTLDLKTALHENVNASLAIFSEAAEAMSAAEVDTAIGVVCRRGYWFSSGVRQYEPTDPDVNLCEMHEILTGQNENSLRLTKLALYLANGGESTALISPQEFSSLHKGQIEALFRATPNISGAHFAPLYGPSAAVDPNEQKTTVSNNVLRQKNYVEWVKVGDDKKPILGMTSILSIQDEAGILVPKYTCAVSFHDLGASCEFLMDMRAAYERAKEDSDFIAAAMIDYPELMEKIQQQLNQALLLDAQNVHSVSLSQHLKPARKKAVYTVIDDMLSSIFATKAALCVFLAAPGRSALEKLSDLKTLCGFDPTLAQSFDSHLHSLIKSLSQAQRKESTDTNGLVLTQYLLTSAVKNLVKYPEDPLILELSPSDAAYCPADVNHLLPDEPVNSEPALIALEESSEPAVVACVLPPWPASLYINTRRMSESHCYGKNVPFERVQGGSAFQADAIFRPADVNHLLPAEPVNSEPALMALEELSEPAVVACVLPPWPASLYINTRRMSESHCYGKNQPFTNSQFESSLPLLTAQTVMASPIRDDAKVTFPPSGYSNGFLKSTGVLATVGHFYPSPKPLRLARALTTNALRTP